MSTSTTSAATDNDAPAPAPLLSARALRIPAAGAVAALTLDFDVMSGELHLIQCQDPARTTRIVDTLLGIEPASIGKVRFLDQDWGDLTTDEANGWRRNIGRVQHQGNWMETRPIMDSLLLPLRHHTVLPDKLLQQYASELARRFGLPGIPLQLPGDCATADLERAACVRAFLGRPRLVLLEHPMSQPDPDMKTAMINAMQQVRRRNGAVVWFTEHNAIIDDACIPATRRYRIVGGQLLDQGAAS